MTRALIVPALSLLAAAGLVVAVLSTGGGAGDSGFGGATATGTVKLDREGPVMQGARHGVDAGLPQEDDPGWDCRIHGDRLC